MSEIAIHIHEYTDECFFAAIKAAKARGRLVSFDMQRNLKPEYRWFKLVGFTGHGGTARVVVDVDDDVAKQAGAL